MSSLVNNPFHLLGASTADNRRRIVELAEEKSLSLDPQVCTQARADLTSPRNRLTAEAGWLLGLDAGAIAKLIPALSTSPLQAVAKLSASVPCLTLANLLAHALEQIQPAASQDEWKKLLAQLAEAVEYIDAKEVLNIINKERAKGGFPEVPSREAVEAEIAERRRHYKQVARDALNRLPTLRLVEIVNNIVDTATFSGSEHAPLLVSDLLDAYELEAQTFLQREGENVKHLVGLIVQSAPKGSAAVAPWLDRLDQVLRNWGRIARPIQTMMKTRGLSHAMSNELFNLVRSMGIYLFNEHHLVEAEVRLLGVLREVFGASPEMVELLAKDMAYMEGIGVEIG